jgi:very-short-patch-repair endonuclease
MTVFKDLTPALGRELRELPVGRTTLLPGIEADDLAALCADGSSDLPAVLVYAPQPPSYTVAQFVGGVLDELERVAIGIFPAWLPEADKVHSPGGAGVAAVRALASKQAHRSGQYAPLASDLAAAALAGRAEVCTQHMPERRARGIAWLLMQGFKRTHLVLAVNVASGLSFIDEQIVVAGCEWLALHGRCAVTLTGEPLRYVDRLASATGFRLPSRPKAASVLASVAMGVPHHRSAAEAALEAKLAQQAWATGRRWNETYQSHPLRDPIRLDLLWPDEHCVVEIDGPEHRELARFDADRRRDVQLQLDGYAVLRFTNARVLHDVDAVAGQIRQFIETRRSEIRGARNDR